MVFLYGVLLEGPLAPHQHITATHHLVDLDVIYQMCQIWHLNLTSRQICATFRNIFKLPPNISQHLTQHLTTPSPPLYHYSPLLSQMHYKGEDTQLWRMLLLLRGEDVAAVKVCVYPIYTPYIPIYPELYFVITSDNPHMGLSW